MNGPAHYQEAERLLESWQHLDIGSLEAGQAIARAQVHATLALAAATAEPFPDLTPRAEYEATRNAWREAGAW